MPRSFKPWGEHSSRWQTERLREGATPQRWDRWRGLSDKSRSDTNPLDYSKGESVRDQIRNTLERNVTQKLTDRANATSIKPVDPRVVQKNTKGLSNSELRKIEKMSKSEMDKDAERRSRRATTSEPSPYWYH